MKDKYVLDSCIWIELERKNPVISERVLPLIEKNQVCLVDVIVAEVLRGVKSQKDFNHLKESFSNFNQLSTPWSAVAKLPFQVSRKGFHPPLVDLYIAQCVFENKRTLITQDKHFDSIARVRDFSVELFKV